MAVWFLRIAAVYLSIGVVLGMTMGIIHDFTLTSVHAHINLLGWLSMAAFGLIYHFYPRAAETVLAKNPFLAAQPFRSRHARIDRFTTYGQRSFFARNHRQFPACGDRRPLVYGEPADPSERKKCSDAARKQTCIRVNFNI